MEKTAGELLKEKLFYTKKHGGELLTEAEINEAFEFCKGYREFLDYSKTERRAVLFAERVLKENGFVKFEGGVKYNKGDKVYKINRGKAIIAAVMGEKSLSEGVKISAAHIDSPRLDLKQVPVYEDNEIAYFKTHYYGGIRKYQWPTVPLALYGTVVRADGSTVDVVIGESEDDPVFCVSDLLPHLAQTYAKKPMAEAVDAESLNLIVGSLPFRDDKASEKVKLNLLSILFEKYNITEADFLSAELEAVPAFSSRDIGFDRSLIGAYGHDDRVCAYPALMAAVNCIAPEYTTVTVLTDKEEIGSEGNTGLNSSYLKYFIGDLAAPFNLAARQVLSKSECLSADVNAAFDPNFPEVFEKRNASFLNYGVVVTKYTGARGKSDTSDASAEYTGKIRNLFDSKNIIWQTGELGRVDIGGGGTVAKYIAGLDVDVIDVGVPVLSMHSPYEIVSKIDVYMAYKAFSAFFEQK
ncbi:MAG: aminopeptidase [Ruminococcaceae bacterium]|nr:aminopeptidase [Oscillospiraceae bacterium]